MIRSGRLASADEVSRFQAEAAAAAKLDHPHIVPIFDVGEEDGQHYYSMAFVEGQSLAERIVAGPVTPRESAAIVKQVALATAYAHGENVIHRDLKPANVMLDKSHKARVTDFGLAKVIEENSTLTATGQVMGTPGFMPPEQAMGRNVDTTPLSDVYSVGAILYATSTGRPPFQAATPFETITQVINQEVVPPRALNPAIPADLETICLKCLEKEPQRRYQSATELSDDLTRFLNQEPILAKPATQRDRIVKWCKRHPSLAKMTLATIASVLLAILFLVAGLTLIWVQNQHLQLATAQAQQASMLANNEAENAKQAQAHAQSLSYNLTLSEVSRLRKSHPGPARALLQNGERCPVEFRDFAWRYLNQTLSKSELMFDANSAVSCMAVAPSGRSILTGHSSGYIRQWDLRNGKPLGVLGDNVGSSIVSLAVSPTGKMFAISTDDGDILRYELNSAGIRNESESIGYESEVAPQLLFSNDGKQLIWNTLSEGNQRQDLIVFDINSGKELGRIVGVTSAHKPAICMAEYRNSVFVSDGENVKEWDVASQTLIRKYDGHQGPVRAFVSGFDVSAPKIGTASVDGTAKLWDASSGQTIQTFTSSGPLVDVGITWDENLVTCGDNGEVKYWDAQTGKSTSTNSEHPRASRIKFSPDTHTLITGGTDGTTQVWNTNALLFQQESGSGPRQFQAGTGPVTMLDFVHNDELLTEVGRSVRTWKRASLEPVVDFASADGCHVTYCPEKKRIIESGNGTTRVLDTISNEPYFSVKSLEKSQFRAAVSPKHPLLVYQDESGDIRVLNMDDESATIIAELDEAVTVVAFHPTEPWLAIGGENGQVLGYQHNGEIQTLTRHAGAVTDLAFSSDGKLLASASADDSVRLWSQRGPDDPGDAKLPWKLLRQLFGHNDDVLAIAFTPDCTTIATAGSDGDLRLWDPLSGYERTRIQIPAEMNATLLADSTENTDLFSTDPVQCLAFSPNGHTLAVGNSKGRVWLWELEP